MKNIILILYLLCLVSCNNIEKYERVLVKIYSSTDYYKEARLIEQNGDVCHVFYGKSNFGYDEWINCYRITYLDRK